MKGQPTLCKMSAHPPISLPSPQYRSARPYASHLSLQKYTCFILDSALHDLPLPAADSKCSHNWAASSFSKAQTSLPHLSVLPCRPYSFASSPSSTFALSRHSGSKQHTLYQARLTCFPFLQESYLIMHPISSRIHTSIYSGKQHTLCLIHYSALPCRSSASSCSQSTTTRKW